MRIIGHIDMDAFFAEVEKREHDWLRGKPIVVGADPKEGRGRGVVSTADYKAREYGIRSAMPISKAWELAASAKRAGKKPVVFLLPDFRLYEVTSRRIMTILSTYSDAIEQTSIDEAYFKIKITNYKSAWKEAETTAKKIKARIQEEEQLTCSIGIGPNKLIAKIASDFQKPDGLTVVPDDEKERFLEPLAIRKIPGVGPKTAALLARHGVTTVRELKQLPKEDLTGLLRKWGADLWQKARGIDDSAIEPYREAKSIGREETFAEDTRDPAFLIGKVDALAARVIRDMKSKGCTGYRTVSIVVRFSGFETKTRTHTLFAPSDSLETLRFEAFKLFLPFLDRRENPYNKKIRLVGLRVEKLVRPGPHQNAMSA